MNKEEKIEEEQVVKLDTTSSDQVKVNIHATVTASELQDEEELDEIRKAEKLQKPCPEDNANIFSRLSFWWFNGLVSAGYKKPLELSDLYQLRNAERAENLSDQFSHHWNSVKKSPNPSLLLALHRAFGFRFYLCAIPKLIYDMCELISPIFVKWIIEYITNPQPIYVGYVYAGILLLVQMFSLFIIHQYFHVVMTQGLRVKTSLRTAVYSKSLRLSSEARQKMNVGEITNYMSIDTGKIGDLLSYLHLLWSAAFQIIVCLIFLFQLIGVSALAGVFIMLVTIPLNALLTRIIQRLRRVILKFTGDRIKIINEVLQGIRVIKFYAWEKSFLKKALDARTLELQKIRNSQWVQVVVSCLSILAPLAVSVVTFVVYAAAGNTLSPAIVFTAMSYFALLRFPLTFLPAQISAVAEARVSIQRLNDFLLADEVVRREMGRERDYPIIIQNGQYSWHSINWDHHTKKAEISFGERVKRLFKRNYSNVTDEPKAAELEPQVEEKDDKGKGLLKDLNVKIPRGKLTCVVGGVGSGKSSFLQAIIGEMKQTIGETIVSGTVSYTTQQAWIQNATVRNNITFGMPFYGEKYDRVVECCALEKDFDILPARDKTEIGEKGINLSGGQKQRIALARAVYADTDIILMDDPLSAVDAHVGKHIFEHCICDALKEKTRVLVTHQLHFLKNADYILYFENGTITEQGSFAELMQANGTFAQMLNTYTIHEDEVEDATEKKVAKKEVKKEKKTDAKLMQAEERATGSVKASVYKQYIKYAGGWFWVGVLFFLFLLAQLIMVANNFWLAIWSGDKESSSKIGYYMLVYAGLGIGTAVLQFVREIVFTLMGMKAANNMHQKALTRVVHAPTSFFDTTPVGRIINRFSKDTESIDGTVIATLKMFLGCVVQVLSSFIVVVGVTPLFLIPLIPILIVYYKIQQYYRASAREIQRLESITRSPIFAHFGETLTGLATVRAYSEQARFEKDFYRKLDTNSKAAFCQLVAARWLGTRLEFIGRLIVFFSALFAIISSTTFGMQAGLAGLSLSYSLQITGVLNWAVRMATDTESNMNSVERVLHYCDEVEQEAAMIVPDNRPPEDWPQQGHISFNNCVLRYRKDLDPVLRSFSVDIPGGLRYGIVGRTGAGKSSVMQALFRLVEIEEGTIEIDGVDISKIGLEDLRSRIVIIPQDPVIFSGTIRFNLDPFDNHTDEAVWKALELAHLKEKISSLYDDVAEGGENYSVGERQLLCIARAILRPTKVLVMDEATANIDMETDNLIQKTIRTSFKDRTVLTIAHRINTIIDSDRIMVMNQGQLSEYDKPSELLNNNTGMFASLVSETGKANEKYLKRIATGELNYLQELEQTNKTQQ